MKYTLFLAVLLIGFLSPLNAAESPPIPDFTSGGQTDGSHDWLLGPTGLRGWTYFRHEDLTAASRKIIITAVDKGSPADGILRLNDVIQFKAIYPSPAPNQTMDIPITITEDLPDPVFTLTGPSSWDGRQTITITTARHHPGSGVWQQSIRLGAHHHPADRRRASCHDHSRQSRGSRQGRYSRTWRQRLRPPQGHPS